MGSIFGSLRSSWGSKNIFSLEGYSKIHTFVISAQTASSEVQNPSKVVSETPLELLKTPLARSLARVSQIFSFYKVDEEFSAEDTSFVTICAILVDAVLLSPRGKHVTESARAHSNY